MKVKALIYLGPHDAVEVPVLDEEGRRTIIVAERDGAPVEVPATIASSLLESGAWEEPGNKRSSSRSTTTTREATA